MQLRDFRVLDPVLGATYPACLLCREGALIVNLDHIKVGRAWGTGVWVWVLVCVWKGAAWLDSPYSTEPWKHTHT